MLFWKLVLDGDGVGDGVVACDAGATMSRRAATAAKTAPTAVVILPRRRGGRPRVVLLKGENLHVGMVWVAPLQPLRTFGGRVEPVVRCDGADGEAGCDVRHPVGLMLPPRRDANCRSEQVLRRDHITTVKLDAGIQLVQLMKTFIDRHAS